MNLFSFTASEGKLLQLNKLTRNLKTIYLVVAIDKTLRYEILSGNSRVRELSIDMFTPAYHLQIIN